MREAPQTCPPVSGLRREVKYLNLSWEREGGPRQDKGLVGGGEAGPAGVQQWQPISQLLGWRGSTCPGAHSRLQAQPRQHPGRQAGACKGVWWGGSRGYVQEGVDGDKVHAA